MSSPPSTVYPNRRCGTTGKSAPCGFTTSLISSQLELRDLQSQHWHLLEGDASTFILLGRLLRSRRVAREDSPIRSPLWGNALLRLQETLSKKLCGSMGYVGREKLLPAARLKSRYLCSRNARADFNLLNRWQLVFPPPHHP